MSSRDAIDVRVKSFVAELEDLVRSAALEAVNRALGGAIAGALGEAAAPKGKPGRKPGAAKAAAVSAPKAASPVAAKPAGAKRKKGQKRSQAELNALQAKLEGFVKANEGKRIEEISKAISIPTGELTRPMKKLIDEGKVRSTGERRATRYYPKKK